MFRFLNLFDGFCFSVQAVCNQAICNKASDFETKNLPFVWRFAFRLMTY